MNVLHPTLLAAGLAAVALPVLIHLLLRRRYRPMAWAAMRFVRIAHRQQRRRRRIEQILLLIARCLLVACIAVAIAHPFVGARGTRGETTLVLIIDDSLTSASSDADGRREFEAVRAAAVEELAALASGSGDRVAVIAAAAPARALIGAPSLDLSAARRLLEELSPSDSAADFAASFDLAREAAADAEGAVRVVVASSWRAGALSAMRSDRSAGAPAPVSTGGADVRRELVLTPPAASEVRNLRLLSLSVSRGTLLLDDTPAARQVVALIDRTGPADEAVDGVLRATVGDPGSDEGVTVPFSMEQGERTARISFEMPVPASGAVQGGESAFVLRGRIGARPESDAIEGDSTRRVALRISARVDAGVVRARGVATDASAIPASAWIAAALRPDDGAPVRLRELAPSGVDGSSLIGLDLVAVARPDLLTPQAWGALDAFARDGGTVVLFAPAIEGAHVWAEDAAARFAALSGLGRETVVFEGDASLVAGEGAVRLPMLDAEMESLAGSVRLRRVLPVDAGADAVVLRTPDGMPVVSEVAPRAWFVGVPSSTAWSDLPARPLFVPLMQEIARRSPARTVAINADAGGALPAFAAADSLLDEATGDAAPAGLGAPRRAGVRTVLDGGLQAIGVAAINADTDAGETSVTDRARVESALGDLGSRALGDATLVWRGDEPEGRGERAAQGSRLGSLAFALAALLAVVESLIGLGASSRNRVRAPEGVPA